MTPTSTSSVIVLFAILCSVVLGSVSPVNDSKNINSTLFPTSSRMTRDSCIPRKIFRKTASVGGSAGDSFDDANGPNGLYFDASINKIAISYTSQRLQQISFTNTRGQTYSHGAAIGTSKNIRLSPDEHISFAMICYGEDSATGNVLVKYASFTTSKSFQLSGGTRTKTCRTFQFPAERIAVGFFGLSGVNVDEIGFVYRKPLC